MRLDRNLNIVKAQSPPNFHRLAQDIHVSMSENPADRGDLACGNRNVLEVEREVGRQFLDALATSVLGRRPKSQALVYVLIVDRQK